MKGSTNLDIPLDVPSTKPFINGSSSSASTLAIRDCIGFIIVS